MRERERRETLWSAKFRDTWHLGIGGDVELGNMLVYAPQLFSTGAFPLPPFPHLSHVFHECSKNQSSFSTIIYRF